MDRLGRSLQDLCGFLVELHSLGIDLFLHQQGIDIARAKDAGKHCGRPRINPEVGERIRKAHGDTWQARHSGYCEAIRRIADDGAERGTG